MTISSITYIYAIVGLHSDIDLNLHTILKVCFNRACAKFTSIKPKKTVACLN